MSSIWIFRPMIKDVICSFLDEVFIISFHLFGTRNAYPFWNCFLFHILFTCHHRKMFILFGFSFPFLTFLYFFFFFPIFIVYQMIVPFMCLCRFGGFAIWKSLKVLYKIAMTSLPIATHLWSIFALVTFVMVPCMCALYVFLKITNSNNVENRFWSFLSVCLNGINLTNEPLVEWIYTNIQTNSCSSHNIHREIEHIFGPFKRLQFPCSIV